MGHDLEHERTFLVKRLPEGLAACRKKEIVDIFLPTATRHPILRVRRNGQRHEITKKYPVDEADHSVQHEFTIPLTPEEYAEIAASVKGKRFRKVRHYYEEGGTAFEVDVYQDALRGLVVADAEFKDGVGKEALAMPAWCLADVTQEEFLAGGMLCGKSYEEIEPLLGRFGYVRL